MLYYKAKACDCQEFLMSIMFTLSVYISETTLTILIIFNNNSIVEFRIFSDEMHSVEYTLE